MSTASAFRSGQLALANGNAVQLNVGSGDADGVRLKAKVTNSGPIVVGPDNTLTLTNGYVLDPGDEVVIRGIGRTLWVRGTAADVISFIQGTY